MYSMKNGDWLNGRVINCLKFIIKKRKEANLTQKELAEKLYVTESAVSKWERGVSYPDISLVVNICGALNISEHELITASEDDQQKITEKQAENFRNIVKTYSWVFFIIYGISILTTFICNLAVNHTLSWFFIVLAAVMLAFSITSLPVLLHKHRGILTLAAFFATLNLLLLICCIYSGGDWFFITFISLLFAFAVVFLPIILKNIQLSKGMEQNKCLLCFGADTILLFILLAVACAYSGDFNLFFPLACPIALVGLFLPWALMITIRYVKVNGLFRTGICLFISGVYVFYVNSIINFIMGDRPFALKAYDLHNWTNHYIDGNLTLLVTLSCFALAIMFCIGGMGLAIKARQK